MLDEQFIEKNRVSNKEKECFSNKNKQIVRYSIEKNS